MIENTNIPPEGWTAIGAIVSAILSFLANIIQKGKNRKVAKKAIHSAVRKTKEGILVIPEQELKEAEQVKKDSI